MCNVVAETERGNLETEGGIKSRGKSTVNRPIGAVMLYNY